jgi:hypothetical protein
MAIIKLKRLIIDDGFRALAATGEAGDHMVLQIPADHHRDEEKQITVFTEGALEYHRLEGERLWTDRILTRQKGQSSLDFNRETDKKPNPLWPDEWVTKGKMKLLVPDDVPLMNFYCLQYHVNVKLNGKVYNLKPGTTKISDPKCSLLFIARGGVILNGEVYTDPKILKFSSPTEYKAIDDSDLTMCVEIYRVVPK